MIRQGTDALSRGLWLTPFRDTSVNYAAALFRPAPLHPDLCMWALTKLATFNPCRPVVLQDEFSSWDPFPLLSRHCLWSLSPTFARQGFLAAVFAWLEAPTTSSHIFIVPRLLQRDFGRVNKHILFIGQFDDVPVPSHFDPLVPFLLFYLPPFRRELPVSPSSSGRLDPSPIMPVPHWVDAQMEELRGL